MQLSKHFSLAEMCESDHALRMGIDNTPPESLIPNLRRTAAAHEAIREALCREAGKVVTIFVTSGYRCEALEKIICAKDFAAWCVRKNVPGDSVSWSTYFLRKTHPQGRSLDWKAPTFGTPLEVVSFIATRPEIMEHLDQIIMEGSWVHSGWSDKPRHEVLTAKFDAKGVATYTKGLA